MINQMIFVIRPTITHESYTRDSSVIFQIGVSNHQTRRSLRAKIIDLCIEQFNKYGHVARLFGFKYSWTKLKNSCGWSRRTFFVMYVWIRAGGSVHFWSLCSAFLMTQRSQSFYGKVLVRSNQMTCWHRNQLRNHPKFVFSLCVANMLFQSNLFWYFSCSYLVHNY